MSGSNAVLNALLLAPATAPQEGVLRTMMLSGTSLTTLKDVGTNVGPGAPDFSNVVTFGGINYFIARAPDTTTNPGVTRMWRTDGTVDGTYLVPGLGQGVARDWGQHTLEPDSLFVMNDQLLFTAHFPGIGRELWAFNGERGYMLKNINTEFDDGRMSLFPSSYSQEELVPGRNNDTLGSAPSGFVRVGDLVYFSANAGAPSGRELWVTDGTPTGTRLAVDVDPFFYDAPAPKQWYEQVLAIGLVLFDLYGIISTVTGPGALGKWALGSAITLALNGTLDLAGQALGLDESTQTGLNYTIKGIKAVTNFVSGGALGDGGLVTIAPGLAAAIDAFTSPGEDVYASGLTAPENIFTVNGKVLFRGSYNAPGSNSLQSVLYISDGTPGGTKAVEFGRSVTAAGYIERGVPIFNPGMGMLLPGQGGAPDRAIFSANTLNGPRELWITDGTEAGTRVLARGLNPGTVVHDASHAVVGNRLIFGASREADDYWPNDGTGLGTELFVTDGTVNRAFNPQGTRLLKDLVPGAGSSNPSDFVPMNGGAFFLAGPSGQRQLWFTDGTTEGTYLVPEAEGQFFKSIAAIRNGADTTAPESSLLGVPTITNAASVAVSGMVDSYDGQQVELRVFRAEDTGPGANPLGEELVFGAVTAQRWTAQLTLPQLDGQYRIEARAIDSMGNIEATPSVHLITVDRTPPETFLNAVASRTNGVGMNLSGSTAGGAESVRIAVRFEEDDTRVTWFDAPVGADGNWTTTVQLGAHANYRYYFNDRWSIQAFAVDAAGNVDPTPATATTILDLTPARLDFRLGQVNRTSQGYLPVSTSTVDPDAASLLLTVEHPNGTRVDYPLNAYERSFFLVDVPVDGTYIVTSSLYDLAGNLTQGRAVVEVARPDRWELRWRDFTAPETSVNALPARFGGNDLGLSGQASDDAVEVLVRNSQLGDRLVPVEAGQWRTAYDISGVPDPTLLQFRVEAFDLAGNQDITSATTSVLIERTAPDTSIDSGPLVGRRISGRAADVIAGTSAVSGPDANTVLLTMFAPDGRSYSVTTPVGGGRWSVDLPVPLEGEWRIIAAARDVAGNRDATPAEKVLTVDLSPPNATMLALPAATGDDWVWARGTAEGATIVQMRFDRSGAVSSVQEVPVQDGVWVSQPFFMVDALWTITATARDGAGNLDPTPATATVLIDRNIPNDTRILTTTSKGVISGTVEGVAAEMRLAFTFPGDGFEFVANAEVQPNGAWTYTLPEELQRAGLWQVTATGVGPGGLEDATPANAGFLLYPLADTWIEPVDLAPLVPAFGANAVGVTGVTLPGFAQAVLLRAIAPNGTEVAGTTTLLSDGSWTGRFNATMDGSWTVIATARNPLGELDPTPASLTLRVDITPPETTLAAVPAFTTSRDILLTGTASADATQVRVSATGLTDQMVAVVNGAWSATIVNPSDGAYTIRARARDAAGNEDATPAQATTSVDRSAPETLINALPALIGNTTNVTIAGATSGNAAAVDLILTRPDGTSFTATASGTANWSYVLASPADGLWQVSAAARDAAGNRDLTPDITAFTVDRTPPGLTFDTYPTITNAAAQTFSGTAASDAVSVTLAFSGGPGGTRSITVPVTAGAWSTTVTGLPEGGWTISGRALDAAGNLGAWVNAPSISLDLTPPETVVLQSFPFLPLPSFTKAASFAVGGGFETGTTESWVVISLTAPDETVSESIITRGASSTWQTTLSLPQEGIWQLAVTSRDRAGNEDATPFLHSITVDRTGPDAAIDPVATNNGRFTLTGTADLDAVTVTIRGLGIDLYRPVLGGEWSLDINGLSSGPKLLSVTAGDALGNADPTPAFVSFTVDSTPPASSLTSLVGRNAAGATTASEVTLRGTADADAVGITLIVQAPDGTQTALNTTVSGGVWALPLVVEAEGLWSILSGTATDGLGNTGRQTAVSFSNSTILVDRTEPDTFFRNPIAAYNPSVDVIADASDAGSGVAARFLEFTSPTGEVFVNPVSQFRMTRDPNDLGKLIDGTWTVRAYSTDKAGNVDSTPAIATFILDGTAPWTTIDPGVPLVTTTGPFSLAGSAAADAVRAEVVYRRQSFDRSTNETSTFTVAVTDGRWSHQLDAPAEGMWSISVRTQDLVGNWGDAAQLRNGSSVFVDRAAPETTLNAPAAVGGNLIPLAGRAIIPTGYEGFSDGYFAGRDPTLIRLTLTGPEGQVVTLDVPSGRPDVGFPNYGEAWGVTLDARDLGLAPGTWQVAAVATNANGIVDQTPATGSFVVDYTPLETSFDITRITTAGTSAVISGSALAALTQDVRLTIVRGETETIVTVPVDADGRFTYTVSALQLDAAIFVLAAARGLGGAQDATPALVSIRQDSTAPDTRITAPVSNAHVGSTTLSLEGNVSAPDATSIRLTLTSPTGEVLDGTAPVVDGLWSFSRSGLAEGAWTVRAFARDGAGNEDPTPALHVITLDVTPPDTLITAPPARVNAPFHVVTGTLSAGEAGSVALSIERPDGTSFLASTTTAANGTWSYTLPTLLDGVFRVTAIATDLAGNVDPTAAAVDVNVLYDRPDAEISIPPVWRRTGYTTTVDVSYTVTQVDYVLTSPDGVVRSSYTSNWDPADTGAVTFQNTIPAGPDGIWTLTATAQDIYGTRDQTPAVAQLWVDRTPPETAIAAAQWVVADGVARITGTSSDDSTSVTYYLTPPGGVTPDVSAGGWSNVATSAGGAWAITAADLAEGTWTVTAYAFDRANQVDATPATTTFVVDRTAPDTTLAALPVLTNNAQIDARGTVIGSDAATVDLTATGPGGASLSTTVAVVDGGWNWGFTARADGAWTIAARARDAAGNLDATAATGGFTLDTTPPATPESFVRLVTDAVNQNQISVTVPFNADVARYLYTFTAPDGVATVIPSSSTSATFNVPEAAPDGTFLVSVQTQDTAGNLSTYVLTGSIALDRLPPALSAITVTWLPESLEMEFSGTADTASVTLFLRANPAPLWNGFTTLYNSSVFLAPVLSVVDGAWSYRVTDPGERPWSYEARATDSFGRTSYVAQQTYLPDMTRPDTSIAPLPPRAAPGLLTVTGTATLEDATHVAILASGPDGAVVTAEVAVTNGVWSWDFAAPVHGEWSIAATARDAVGNRDATPATAQVDIGNFPAITSAGVASFVENATGVAYAALGADWDGGAVIWSLTGADAERFTVNSEGEVRFKAAPDFEAPLDQGANNSYDFTLIATGVERSLSRAVTISVTNVNDVGPVITSGGAASFAENGTGVAYMAAGNDPEGASLTWSLEGADEALFTINNQGEVRFKASPDFETPADADGDNAYAIEVVASDGGLAARRAVTISVTNVNDVAPVITSGGAASFAENGTGVAYMAAGNDPEGASLTWSLEGADEALFTINGDGEVRFKAAPDFEAPLDQGANNSYDITIIASDGDLITRRAVTISVTNVNDMAPVITSGGAASFAENGTGVAYTAIGTDGDGGVPRWSLSGDDAALFTINAAGEIRFRNAPDFEQPADTGRDNRYEITVTAADDAYATSQDVTITVTNVNDLAPIMTAPASVSVAENRTTPILQANAVDPEGDAITWSLEGDDAARFTLDAEGVLQFLSPPDFEAPADANRDNLYQVTLVASDGGLTTSQALTIAVTDQDDISPVITSPAAMRFLENGTGVVHLARATDAAGRPVSWTLSGTDANLFTIDPAGALRFRATPDFEAPADANADNRYDLLLTGSAGGAPATQALQITVVNVDEAPIVTSYPSVGYIENYVTLAFQGAAIDPEGAALSWSLSGEDAALFRLDPRTGGLRFITTPNYEAPLDGGGDRAYNVWLTASDGTLSTTSDVWIYLSDDGYEGNRLSFGSRPLDNNFGGRMLGTSGADVMYGFWFSDDTLVGGAGNDFFDGGTVRYESRTVLGSYGYSTGDDLFDPGAGNDTFMGGDGTDSVVYRQAASTSTPTVTLVSGTTYIVTESAGTTDTLTDVEFAYFTDGVWDLVGNRFMPYGLTLTSATSQAEGGAGAVTPYNYTLTRTGTDFLGNAQEFFWRVDVGTGASAATAADFAGGALPWGRVSFAANQSSVVIPVMLAGDSVAEGNEAFTLRIFREIGGEAGVSMDLVSRGGTITDGGAAPATLSFTSGTPGVFTEGGSGSAYLATATHSAAGITLAWSLGGVDGALFTIDATGALRFRGAPDFKHPLDAGVDNVYDVNVTASGGGLTASKAIAITVVAANQAPSVTSGGTAGFAENGTGPAYEAFGSDPDAGTTLSWILGGADRALFDISDNGVVTFKAAPNFEAPADAGANNVYDITVTAWDGALGSAPRAVAITVTNVNEAPSVASGGTARFAENGTGTVYQALGTDPDAGATLSWLLGGDDAGLFDISAMGAVTFKTSPNFEVPADAGGNNVYDITVTASDGALSSAPRAVAITVTDMEERVRLVSGTAADRLTGTSLNDTLIGGVGNDTLIGGDGNDRLDGGVDADSLEGGAGDDIYFVDNAGDAVIELANEGYDRVVASIHYTLGDEVERLSLWGLADLNGTGNGLANRLGGNAGANILDGGEGNDSLYGLAGNDTLIGGDGNDRLDGGVDADSLTGGTGADIFYFRSATEADGDVITDFNPAENDRIDLRPIDADLATLGNQGFTWIGGAPFSGMAGQLRFANSALQADMDGDRMADFQIGMAGVASLTSASVWL